MFYRDERAAHSGCAFDCRRIFNKERWGRRAPWLLLHCPLMACLMYAGWAPPSLDGSFLAHWYFWTQLLGMWCCEHLLIGNMAGSAEAYPYKAERVVVESLNVAFACFGVICSILVIGVAYADEQLDEKPGLRSTLGLACLVVGLLSLPSAWALRDARHYGSLMPAEEVAGAVVFAVTRPPGVVIDTIDMYPEAPLGSGARGLR